MASVQRALVPDIITNSVCNVGFAEKMMRGRRSAKRKRRAMRTSAAVTGIIAKIVIAEITVMMIIVIVVARKVAWTPHVIQIRRLKQRPKHRMKG